MSVRVRTWKGVVKRALIVLMLAGVASADAPPPAAPPPPPAPTANALAKLYVEVGQELMRVSRRDSRLTANLWPRYRWIHLLDAMSTPAKRLEAQDLLDRLHADLIVAAARGASDAS